MKNLRNYFGFVVLLIVLATSVFETRAGLLVSDFAGTNTGSESKDVCTEKTADFGTGVVVINIIGSVVTNLTGVVVTDGFAKSIDCGVIVHD